MTTDGYRDLLHRAYAAGRDDGSFAATFEPEEPGAPAGRLCRGREPGDFARWLWSGRPGEPPAGLELDAPLWYAIGFAEALAAAGHERCTPARPPHTAGSSRATGRRTP